MTSAHLPLRRVAMLRNRRPAVAIITIVLLVSAVLCVQFAGATTTYPSDNFNDRTMSSWGNATVGGAYTYIGPRAQYYVSSGRGVMTAAPGIGRGAFVNAPTGQIQITAGVGGPATGTGWGYAAYVTARRVPTVGEYRARLHIDASGNVFLGIVRGNAKGSDVLLGNEVAMPNLHFGPDSSVRLTLSTSGANPTTLRAKVWQDGEAVPTVWNLTVKDATAGIQGGGAVGVRLYNSRRATSNVALQVFAWATSAPEPVTTPTQPSTTGPSSTISSTTVAPSTTTSGTATSTTTSGTATSTTVPTTVPPSTQTPTTQASSQPGSNGSFRVECEFSHRAQVDPIVAPGEVSAHMHDFFGNHSTAANSTYASMQEAATNCTESGDLAGYWSPTLVAPNGTYVNPERSIFYYRNRPYEYGTTLPFPPNFRMIAGGTFPNSYWTCDGESDTGLSTRKDDIPDCGSGGKIKLHVFFPSCWDGVHLDSANHRSHVAYGLDSDGHVDGTDPDTCPASHPIKIPQLDFRALYDVSDGRGYHFSDGMMLAHADFWNTWNQSRLEHWVSSCLGRVGMSCGLASS